MKVKNVIEHKVLYLITDETPSKMYARYHECNWSDITYDIHEKIYDEILIQELETSIKTHNGN